MNLVHLTHFILEVNHLVDTGQYTDISITEVERHIEAQDLVKWLKQRVGDDADLSLYRDLTVPSERVSPGTQLNDGLRDILGAYRGKERRKWGVERSGLCLLLAWTNELIAQRKWTDE